MIAKRDQEIEMLEGLLRKTADPADQQRITLRLVASIHNRASWQAYLDQGSPKESRAVIVP
jgi:hypothetical protein